MKAKGGGENDGFGALPFYLYGKNGKTRPKGRGPSDEIERTARMGVEKLCLDWSVGIDGPYDFSRFKNAGGEIFRIVRSADRSDGPYDSKTPLAIC